MSIKKNINLLYSELTEKGLSRENIIMILIQYGYKEIDIKRCVGTTSDNIKILKNRIKNKETNFIV